ncbi:H-2 class II histocompatibility antigen, E-D beta chain-like [Hoplias malabaricus]|uniref:H-2 class II histocompatibility antigen, E-D beta chain-like n=1 Tax=Hoplias malabaricus TaxID=27720 RepID=UPI0034625188
MGNKDTENNGLFTWRCLRAQTQWTLSSSTVSHREEKRSPERNRGMKVFLSWSWCVFSLLTPGSTAVVSGKHSLFYLSTVQSEDSSYNIYQFSEETLLDDTQTDSYSSRDGIRSPKQSWMKEMEESEWRTGTEKLKSEGQWMNKVLQLQLEVFRHKASALPDVYVFVKKSQTESSRVTLTCLATGFYSKDLKMRLRRSTTSLPDHLLTSSGVRPNGDGTYQLRKSVDVQEEDAAGYDCSVSHVSFSEAVITPWDGRCSNCRNNLSPGEIGGVIVGVISLVLLGLVIFILFRRRRKTDNRVGNGVSNPTVNGPEGVLLLPPGEGDGDIKGAGGDTDEGSDS